MSEFDWIDRYFAPLAADDSLSFGLKNDAALLSALDNNKQWVIASDTLIESVHFLADTSPDLIAQKALRVNLSDMAAMGATPYGYLLNLSLKKGTDENWMQAFASGFKKDQDTFNVTLLGGDTTASEQLTISVTMLGQAEQGKALTRSGAKIGDTIYVSGTIGDASIGLNMVKENDMSDPSMVTRHQLPEPRIALGETLTNIATSCMDISDGLLQDMDHICSSSQLGAQIELSQIPLSPTAKQWLKDGNITISDLLNGGDDYELLFTASTHAQVPLGVTAIGYMIEGNSIQCLQDGEPIEVPIKGYQHL